MTAPLWLRKRSCRRVRRQIDDWLDQRSVAQLPDVVGEHMRTCEPCRRYVAQWHALELQLRSLRSVWPPESALHTLPVTVLEGDRIPSPERRTVRLVLQGAAVLAVAVLVSATLYLAIVGRAPQMLARGSSQMMSPAAQPGQAMSPDLPVAATR